MPQERRIYVKTTIFLLILHVITFVISYFSTFLFSDSDAAGYVYLFSKKATYLLAPSLLAAAMLLSSAEAGTRSSLLFAIIPGLTRLVYSLPFFTLSFISDGVEIGISLLAAAGLSLIEASAFYMISILLFLIMNFIIKRKSGTDVKTALEERTVLNFYEPVSLAFATVSVIAAAYFVIVEIVDTVSFLLSYGGFYPGEIVYTVISYIFDISVFFINYYALCKFKNMFFYKDVQYEQK